MPWNVKASLTFRIVYYVYVKCTLTCESPPEVKTAMPFPLCSPAFKILFFLGDSSEAILMLWQSTS